MLSVSFVFFTSLLCALSIVFIELFHMIHTKQQNGIVVWKVAESVADTLDSMLNADASELDTETDQTLDSPV
jgi:hypothetical protein